MGIIGLLIIGYLGYRFICWVFGPDPTLSPEEQKEVEEEKEEVIEDGEATHRFACVNMNWDNVTVF